MIATQQMNTAQAHSCCRGASQTSPTGSRWSRYLPAWLHGGRFVVLGAAVVALGGAALGWPWLVAAGLAPILLSLAPCAAMCALGYCMMGKGANPAAPQDGTTNAAISTIAPLRLAAPERERATLS